MKMTNRILATATAALTVTAALAGCTGGTSSTTSKAAPSQADANKVYNIGICQLVQHEALDAATKGFKDNLTDELGADKDKFDEQSAQEAVAAVLRYLSRVGLLRRWRQRSPVRPAVLFSSL